MDINPNHTIVIELNVTYQLNDMCGRNGSCQVEHKNTDPDCCWQLSAETGSSINKATFLKYLCISSNYNCFVLLFVGEMMVSLLWYYRPEHIDHGCRLEDMEDEIFASKHRDISSVACIEDKCYVLTFNEYCRYVKYFGLRFLTFLHVWYLNQYIIFPSLFISC